MSDRGGRVPGPGSGHLLTLNAGSSSLKFALFDRPDSTRLAAGDDPRRLLSGQIEGLGTQPHLEARAADGRALADRNWHPSGSPEAGHERVPDPAAVRSGAQAQAGVRAQAGAPSNVHDALGVALDFLRAEVPELSVRAIGHRVVHGGVDFAAPVVLDDAILDALEKLDALAPLHQPHNIRSIRAAGAAFPGVTQVACFDTAFHRGHAFVHDTFALPREYYEAGVRRYGFHGLSYEYIARRLARIDPRNARGRVVVAHLGSGASACAIRDGRSVASTMGFTALDGLPMGTRPGQLDPGVILWMLQQKAMSADAIADLLYRRSGLKGMSGVSNDLRELHASDSRHAGDAIDYFVERLREAIGALAASLGGLDALVFTAGIGENDPVIRARTCATMDWLGVRVDDDANAAAVGGREALISAPDSRVAIRVIPTDEERVIAGHTMALARD